VSKYYREVETDHTETIDEFRRRLKRKDIIIEPIGWTSSGRLFADVLSGDLRIDTVEFNIPRSFCEEKRRYGRLKIEIVNIYRLDLPEFFESRGERRIAFSSVMNDRIFLDRRYDSDEELFKEAIEHEISHLLDRPLYSVLSPEDLEIRAMIRGLSRGGIHRINKERLFFALKSSDKVYRRAAEKILRAFATARFQYSFPIHRFERPGRYIGDEINSILKSDSLVSIALCFPEMYEVGMSHLGLKILYERVNRDERFSAERVFLPGRDFSYQLQRSGEPLRSLETKKPISYFDLLGFSVAYEMSYPDILHIMQLGKIPVRRNERNSSHPIVIAGGHLAFQISPGNSNWLR